MTTTLIYVTLPIYIAAFRREGVGWGGDCQYLWEGGGVLDGVTWHFIGGLDNDLETMLYYLTCISL